MLKEKALAYYLDQGHHCAESIFMAASDVYGLGFDEGDLSLLMGFSGGMGVEGTCGLMAGSVAVLGKMFAEALGEDFRPAIAAFHRRFSYLFGGCTECNGIKPRYNKPDTRCAEAVGMVCDLLEAYIDELNDKLPKKETPVYEAVPAAEIKRVKGLGFLHNKNVPGLFQGRVITRNGKVTARELAKVAKAAERFGTGEVTFTSRLTMEVQGVPYDKIEDFRAYLAEEGLETGGTGAKVRPVVSCKGTTCQYGLIDTFGLSEKIHERFYKGYETVKLPHKFKIAVGGCPNNCVKPDLDDLGIIGQRVPKIDLDKCRGCKKCMIEAACPIKNCHVENGKIVWDAEGCNHCGRCVGKCPFGVFGEEMTGYKVYVGGRWGKRFARAMTISKIFTSEEEVLNMVEKAILYFKENGQAGERFSDTIQRIGFDVVEKELLSDDILARKEEILAK